MLKIEQSFVLLMIYIAGKAKRFYTRMIPPYIDVIYRDSRQQKMRDSKCFIWPWFRTGGWHTMRLAKVAVDKNDMTCHSAYL